MNFTNLLKVIRRMLNLGLATGTLSFSVFIKLHDFFATNVFFAFI